MTLSRVRKRKRVFSCLVIVFAGLMMLWLSRASLAYNVANVLHLRITLDPAQRRWVGLSDRLYQLAAMLGINDQEIAFQRGALAWRAGETEQALDLWQAGTLASAIDEFIRAQQITGDVVSLCVALEHREALWQMACEPCYFAYARSRRNQDVLRLFDNMALDDPLTSDVTSDRRRTLAWIYFEAGKALYDQRSYPAAVEKLLVAQALFEVVPPVPEALYSMIGVYWFTEGYLDEAEVYLRRAPNELNAALSLADLLIQRQDWDSAIKTSDWGVAHWPTIPHFYRKKATVYAATGQDQLATEANAEAERLQRESTPNAQ